MWYFVETALFNEEQGVFIINTVDKESKKKETCTQCLLLLCIMRQPCDRKVLITKILYSA